MYEYFCAVMGFSSHLGSTAQRALRSSTEAETVIGCLYSPHPVLRFQRNCCQAIESHEKFCAKQKENNRSPVVPHPLSQWSVYPHTARSMEQL
jgi:hypothetical protein